MGNFFVICSSKLAALFIEDAGFIRHIFWVQPTLRGLVHHFEVYIIHQVMANGN